jgi:uncharacterized protein
MGICSLFVIMARPKCYRKIASFPEIRQYLPDRESSSAEAVILSLDEREAVRLADFEGFYQEKSALKMGISRQTFGRIIESAHRKIADALLHGKALKIEGGTVAVGKSKIQICTSCGHPHVKKCRETGKRDCPRCRKISKEKLNENCSTDKGTHRR